MSWMCPVCNGFEALAAACPGCSDRVDDNGRYNDYLGPYSPYREIDGISQSNGLPDLQNSACAHLASCPACGVDFPIFVQGWET